MRPNYIFLFCLGIAYFLNVGTLSSQSIQGRILDAQTNAPIFNAFIFIDNSSIGTTTDLEGYFQLDLKEVPTTELVVSHINYERITLTLDRTWQNGQAIYLESSAMEIGEVMVASKKSKKRDRWIKSFEDAFLGTSDNREEVSILNPEVLLFQEDTLGLHAMATDQILIQNDALGYQLRFYLDSFIQQKDNLVLYTGKVFFEDQLYEQPDTNNVLNARATAFAASRQAFFQQLLQGSYNKRTYQIGVSDFSESNKPPKFERLKQSDIQLTAGPIYDTLRISEQVGSLNGHLTIRHKRKNRWRSWYPVSYLKPYDGYYLVAPNGELANSHRVEEAGYWAKLRIADLMPVNYGQQTLLAAKATPTNLLDSLIAYQQKVNREKVFVLTNKPYYSHRDTIWFSSFLLDGYTHEAATPSQVLHVDLINANGELMDSRTLHAAKGLDGAFVLPEDSPGGVYQLRAYTNYMLGFEHKQLFQKAIPIYNFSQEEALSALPWQSEPTTSVELAFFPEGGVLVENVPNTLAFTVRDNRGLPLAVEGQIVDGQQRVVSAFNTYFDGIGLMNLRPMKGSSYFASVTYADSTYLFPFPAAQAEGISLNVNASQEEVIYFKVLADEETDLSDTYIIGQTRGAIFGMYEKLKAGRSISLDRNAIPTGIGQLSLFTAQGELLAECLFYNPPSDEASLKVNAPYAYHRPRQEVVLDVELLDSYELADFNKVQLAVTVTDQSVVPNPLVVDNMQRSLLLDTELSNTPYWPLNALGAEAVRAQFYTNLHLMTQQLPHYDWKKLQQKSDWSSVHMPETGFSVKGYTTKKDSEQRVRSNLMLTVLEPNFYASNTISDAEGNFRFDNLPMLDSTNFNLQGRLTTVSAASNVAFTPEGNKDLSFHLTTTDKPSIELLPNATVFQARQRDSIVQVFLAKAKRRALLDSVFRPTWEVDLDEIVVKGRRPGKRYVPSGAYDVNQMDWIPPEQTAFSLLTRLRPRKNYRRNFADGKLYWVGPNEQGEIVVLPVVIFVNDLLSSLAVFQSLTADMIDYIVIQNTYIGVYTRKNGPRSLQASLQNGILNFSHRPYDPIPSFEGPDYTTPKPIHQKPDLRTCLHWSPRLRFDATGKAQVRFFAADTPGMYEVRIEGVLPDGQIVSVLETIEIRED
ncbi:MAG: carboxypeptidase-like regulatory domain-containing protein [Bacteroidota bacterium]